MKPRIIPSIIAKNQKELDERLRKVKFSKIIQLDVMDGKFLKNKSLLFDFKIPYLNKNNRIKYEAHLMMKNPRKWIKKHHKKVSLIIIHLESDNVESSIALIKKYKRKIGIALNPKTLIKKLKNLLMKDIDTLLIMSVNPGKYGSSFLPNMMNKVKDAREKYPKLNIEVDGGINDKTIEKVKKAMANKFVVGSYLQNADNVREKIDKLKKIVG